MNEIVPKKKRAIFDRRSVFFSLCFLICYGILLGVVLRGNYSQTTTPQRISSWGTEEQRSFANKLQAEGLVMQAAHAYEAYLADANIALSERANIYMMLGEAFLRQEKYEDALAYLYKAEIADPKGILRKDIGVNIVTCLEKLGKSLDAQSALSERAALTPADKDGGDRGEIVAQIGSRIITMGEINDAIHVLPAWMQQSYKEEQAKAAFIQQYVANQVLYKKGKMLQYDTDADVMKQLDKAKENLVVQRVLKDVMSDMQQPDPADVKNYYETHKDAFAKTDVDGKKTEQPFDAVAEQVTKAYQAEKMESKMQEFIMKVCSDNDVAIFYNPPAPEEVPETAQAATDVGDATESGNHVVNTAEKKE